MDGMSRINPPNINFFLLISFALVLNLLKDIFERSGIPFNRFRASAGRIRVEWGKVQSDSFIKTPFLYGYILSVVIHKKEIFINLTMRFFRFDAFFGAFED